MENSSINYCTKEDLYQYVNGIKGKMGIDPQKTGIDFYEECQKLNGIKMEVVDFTDRSLRGLSVPKQNIILLNSSRSPIERNFDCAHEFIHVVKHKKEVFQTFNCFDKLRPQQNPYLEWQANEGAAEMLVPYKLFIPMFCEHVEKCNCGYEYYYLKEYLAKHFNVPLAVIELRIDNLRYEIQQYETGCDISKLRILSNSQQSRRGIAATSYNTKFDFYDWIEYT